MNLALRVDSVIAEMNTRPDRVEPLRRMMTETLRSGRSVFVMRDGKSGSLTWTNDWWCSNQHVVLNHGTVHTVIYPPLG